MGFIDKLRAELVDIIEWVDDSRHTLVWRFPRYHNQIKNGAQLIVRPGQVRRVRAPGPDRRRVRARPAPARDRQPADPLHAGRLDARLRQPVQGRGLLRQHAADHRSQVGHAEPGACCATRTSAPCACARSAPTRCARSTPRRCSPSWSAPTQSFEADEITELHARDHQPGLRRRDRRRARSRVLDLAANYARLSERGARRGAGAHRRRVRPRGAAALHRQRVAAGRGGEGARHAQQHGRDRRPARPTSSTSSARRCRSRPRTRRAASPAPASASAWAWRWRAAGRLAVRPRAVPRRAARRCRARRRLRRRPPRRGTSSRTARASGRSARLSSPRPPRPAASDPTRSCGPPA